MPCWLSRHITIRPTQQGLIRHYHVIADAVDIPLIVYDVPSRTGVSIAPETYAELAKHPQHRRN
jgi:4-hydroxy-tetrahydrodipicolinate synthase